MTRQTRTRVKICGLTRREDVAAAVDAGADALGFVFVEQSPRAISIEQAADLFACVPPFVQSVALFLDPSSAWVDEVIQRLGPDLLQFHGRESGAFCSHFGRPYLKALGTDQFAAGIGAAVAEHPQARGFLLDSHVSGAVGGTGQAFDTRLWPRDAAHRLILAGGLNPDNVAEAIRATRPYAVDVSSGVEAAPGLKDPEKINAFVQRALHA